MGTGVAGEPLRLTSLSVNSGEAEILNCRAMLVLMGPLHKLEKGVSSEWVQPTPGPWSRKQRGGRVSALV